MFGYEIVKLILCFRFIMIKSIIQRPISPSASSCRVLSIVPSPLSTDFFDKYDPQQVQLLSEQLMVVDKQDRIIGQTTKKDGHLLANIEAEPSLIHRAFSFFLFDLSSIPSRLIIQQRSAEKITYPLLWANTCCSHPLFNEIEIHGIKGVKHAVKRRVQTELGHDLNIDLIYLSRIFYQARNIPDDGIFGESEIDYIIFGKYENGSPLSVSTDFQINKNEVKEIRAVTLSECEELSKQGVTTPWFTRIIRAGLLAKWWSAIDKGELERDNEVSEEIIQL